jgi:hypothetical protein
LFSTFIAPVLFPDELERKYGLTIEALSTAFECEESDASHWSLQEVPNVEFYTQHSCVTVLTSNLEICKQRFKTSSGPEN